MLHDLAGKPVELRAIGKYVPVLGTRFDCPRCQTAYFACYRTRGDCADCYDEYSEQTWEVDLSYWASYNDEPDEDMQGLGAPRGLVTEGWDERRTPLHRQIENEIPNCGVPRCECGHQAALADVAGRPLELRSREGEVPRAGVRFDCPCGRAYFVHYRTRGHCAMCAVRRRHPPDYAGRWELDFYWWSTYDTNTAAGDTAGAGTPLGLVLEGREEQRHSLTHASDFFDLRLPYETGPRSRPSALAERLAV